MYEYDPTIIDGRSIGLVLAICSAKLGKKTALVEKFRLGGDSCVKEVDKHEIHVQ